MKYEVTFKVQVTEAVSIEANSPKEAEEIAGDRGWWQSSEGNWEIIEQYIDVEDITTVPEPYPYTHPIREVSGYSKIKK